jgi:predicted RNase H-like nuclease
MARESASGMLHTWAMAVLGVDGCKKGWAGILVGAERQAVGLFAGSMAELLDSARELAALDVVAVDMPIGLSDRSIRQADVQARQFVGPRRSSVFTTPTRAAVQADSHAKASAINLQLTGQGISQQAYALRERLLEVDKWVRQAVVRVIEVHPEVSFARMAGQPLEHPKSTWAGMTLRRALLGAQGIEIPDDIGELGRHAGVDDVLDAAAAAWSARRASAGLAVSMPDPPQCFDDRLTAAIWS